MAAFQISLGISTQKAPPTLPELVNRSQPETHLALSWHHQETRDSECFRASRMSW